MPAFQYKAMDTQGKSHQGILEADSARLIRQQLRDKNLLPVEVSPVQKNRCQSQPIVAKRGGRV